MQRVCAACVGAAGACTPRFATSPLLTSPLRILSSRCSRDTVFSTLALARSGICNAADTLARHPSLACVVVASCSVAAVAATAAAAAAP